MSDLKPAELSDEKLAELSQLADTRDPRHMFKEQQKRERDAVLAVIRPTPPGPADPLGDAKAKVAQLEEQLAEARKLPIARAVSVPDQMANMQKITGLETSLHWAKRHFADIEAAEKFREIRQARIDNPGASFLFEITTPDGRKIRQEAADLEILKRELQAGYEVTGHVYPGYVAPLDRSEPNLLKSLLAAHGDDLLDWFRQHDPRR